MVGRSATRSLASGFEQQQDEVDRYDKGEVTLTFQITLCRITTRLGRIKLVAITCLIVVAVLVMDDVLGDRG
jgi:hypothetical protein